MRLFRRRPFFTFRIYLYVSNPEDNGEMSIAWIPEDRVGAMAEDLANKGLEFICEVECNVYSEESEDFDTRSVRGRNSKRLDFEERIILAHAVESPMLEFAVVSMIEQRAKEQ